MQLEDLRDVNILVGPNNCGKSSILEIIGLLNNLSPSDHPIKCTTCEPIISSSRAFSGVRCEFSERAKYLGKGKVKLAFNLAKEDVERVLSSETLEKIKEIIASAPDHGDPAISLTEASGSRFLHSDHIYLYDLTAIKEKLIRVVSCPEERLATYKGVDLTQYIRDQKIRANIMQNWIDITREICDSKIETYNTTSLDFVRTIGNEEFVTAIREQGSGVRSLICLMADILSQRQAKIILVDEPELGLNPAGKQALLRFLVRQTATKQVFIATHDPTFVNPILWRRDDVALYLFSPLKDTFMRINLSESQEDPNTFGGFLPHTSSLKRIHLYVEGCLDAYIYQIFLRRFLKSEHPDDWFIKLNNVGIFHLAGDCWSHLLYTIPQTPYHSVVVLDGDKRADAQKAVEKVNESTKLPKQPDRFRFCTKITQLQHRGRPKAGVETLPVLVYCLQKQEIEEYLDPKPKDKKEGPKRAEQMSLVPEEIEDIFRSLPLEAK